MQIVHEHPQPPAVHPEAHTPVLFSEYANLKIKYETNPKPLFESGTRWEFCKNNQDHKFFNGNITVAYMYIERSRVSKSLVSGDSR